MDDFLRELTGDGYVVLPAVLTADEVNAALGELAEALVGPDREAPIRSQAGTLYAARNVLAVWPGAAAVWRRGPLPSILPGVLGPRLGLVRALFCDKPPGQTWALGLHKDMTIAVKNNRLPSALFGKPTRKAGVPHVEAPLDVLESMLTVRLHLDAATPENGPLQVIPGSHRTGKKLRLGDVTPRTLLVERGGAVLMRPLLAHGSIRSHPDTTQHRRVLHLEFAACAALADGYTWDTFLPGLTA